MSQNIKSHRWLTLGLFLTSAQSFASVPLVDTDRWKVTLSGFVEVDSITDSTRSFNEVIGNAPIFRPTTQSGQTGRDQMSIRNSRLAFTVAAPEHEGWKSQGYLEFDLLGFDPTSGSTNTEGGFFNNPTLRLRHGFIKAEKDDWQFLAGQTWMLLGWQPYYFMPSVQVAPVPGMLYSRTVQFRTTKNVNLSDQTHLQGALGIMRPPERDAALPGLEMGVRLAYDGWSGGFVPGATVPEKTQPLSFGISGAVREFSVASNPTTPTGDMTHYMGHAIVADALIPVIPSKDGKDVSGTFTVGGEFTKGTGYGDEFANWTGNLSSPLNALSSAPNSNVTLDSGIGGFDGNGNFNLVDLNTFNFYGQYHLPASLRMWLSGGYAWLYSDNINALTASAASATAVLYNKEQIAFVNVFKDLSDELRVGFEFAQILTTYTDGTVAHNNRYQLSAWFFF
jgi:hypothetical protein